jgi:hypothetical protein
MTALRSDVGRWRGRLGERPGEAEQADAPPGDAFLHGRETVDAQALLDERPIDRRAEVARQAGELVGLLRLQCAAIEVAEVTELCSRLCSTRSVSARGSGRCRPSAWHRAARLRPPAGDAPDPACRGRAHPGCPTGNRRRGSGVPRPRGGAAASGSCGSWHRTGERVSRPMPSLQTRRQLVAARSGAPGCGHRRSSRCSIGANSPYNPISDSSRRPSPRSFRSICERQGLASGSLDRRYNPNGSIHLLRYIF